MSSTIVSKGTTVHPGMYSNGRYLDRCRNGVLWFVGCDAINSRLEFYYSTNNGSSWAEDTSQRISNIDVNDGYSMRVATHSDGQERMPVIYHDSADNKMTVSFGYFDESTRTSFRWHSASPKHTSVLKGLGGFRRPDIECWFNGETWLCPTVWGRLAGGVAELWMGRTRFIPYDSFSVDEVVVHKRQNMQSWPRPSAMLRHLGDDDRIDAASPDLYVDWHQGIDADPDDRFYMMRLGLGNTAWGTGQLRVMEQNGVQSGLTSGCYTGQRAAAVQVPSNATEDILLHLMQPSDSSRETLNVPSPGLGELENVNITWDNATADIYILASGATTQRPHYIVYTWASRTWGSWTQINTDECMPDTLSTKPGSKGSRIECVYGVNPGSSTTFKYALVATTNIPSSVATWNTTGGGKDVNSSLPLDWNHNDADGDPQVQYELRRSVDGAAYEYWNGTAWQGTSVQPSSALDEVTLPFDWGDDGETHEYTVRTNDGQTWAPWSSTLTIQASVGVAPTILTPSAGAYGNVHVLVSWSVTEQSSYRVRLLDDVGDQIETSLWQGSSTVRGYELSTTLTNGDDYTVEVSTKNNEGLASTATVGITAALTPPPTPTWTYAVDSATATITLDIDNGTPGGGEDDALFNNIWRIDLDVDPTTPVLIAIGQDVDAPFIDRTPANDRNYSYAVEAETADGARKISAYIP